MNALAHIIPLTLRHSKRLPMKSSTGQTDSVIARQTATAKKRQTVMAEAQKDEAAI